MGNIRCLFVRVPEGEVSSQRKGKERRKRDSS
jgi:hypothetical protein